MSEKIQLPNGGTIELFRPDTQVQKYMIYFHGGGLVYGSKSDLPNELKQLFLAKEYTVVTVDYLLAPNNTLPEIFSALTQSFHAIQELIGQHSFSFCGRSAGSYLMLLLTNHLLEQKSAALPEQLINFYGYTDFSFLDTERSLSDVAVTKQMIEKTDTVLPVWDDPFLQRYLLYIYGVQNQLLKSYYGLTEQNQDSFTINKEALQVFPPLFSTASTADQEIPFKYSKQLVRKQTSDLFVPVYYLNHDFLKETQDKQVITVFDKLMEWLA
ncbi:alpha/beta hydrolase [Enterococcus sp. BWR-S5]|uniref:alpha/beta hydrolase n=1 Tax=Enterococcus sp. BWR-S5 TaxID=2787714 RepID=UPI00192147DB|nr:alpha/beta hydrolase [Enterococcus sp. BWR-S5]MBL1225514.1 alpha/beta hydrolase [Enterococcus sp. BWR-S5]